MFYMFLKLLITIKYIYNVKIIFLLLTFTQLFLNVTGWFYQSNQNIIGNIFFGIINIVAHKTEFNNWVLHVRGRWIYKYLNG